MKEKVEEKTLRDEFAMVALTGLMSNADWFRYEEDSIAERCYALADAMLAVKEGRDYDMSKV